MEHLDLLMEGEGVMGGGDGVRLRRAKVGFPFLLIVGTCSISFTFFFTNDFGPHYGAVFAKVEAEDNNGKTYGELETCVPG
jgi:hypothetical protein